jgi:hypothetical protein
MSLVLKPKYSKDEVKYDLDIEEVFTQMRLVYDDGDSTEVETIAEDSFVPSWNSPPDLRAKLVMEGRGKTLANSWVRSLTHFSKADLTISEIDRVEFTVAYKNGFSTRAIKITNPFPYPILVSVYGGDSSKDVVGDDLEILVPAESSQEYNVVKLVNYLREQGAVWLLVTCHMYNSLVPLNWVVIDGDGEGFYLPMPTVDGNTGNPEGPTVAIDSYNLIDRYGVWMTGFAAAATGVSQAYSVMRDDPSLNKIAVGLGVGIADIAIPLAIGLNEEWIDTGDIAEMIIPMLTAGLTPAVSNALLNELPSRYTGMVNSALSAAVGIGGTVISAASATTLLAMMDNIKCALEV